MQQQISRNPQSRHPAHRLETLSRRQKYISLSRFCQTSLNRSQQLIPQTFAITIDHPFHLHLRCLIASPSDPASKLHPRHHLGPAAGCQGRHGVLLHGARAQRNHRGIQRQILPEPARRPTRQPTTVESGVKVGNLGPIRLGLVMREHGEHGEHL